MAHAIGMYKWLAGSSWRAIYAMNIKNAIEVYLWSRSKKLSSNTIRNYTHSLNAFSKWVGESKPLEEIYDLDIDSFQIHLKGRLSEKTQDNYAYAIKGFFKYWKAKGRSQVAWELIEGPRIPEKVPNFISPDQYDLIDDFLDADNFSDLTKRTIINLLWDTGMRIGELVSLDLKDVDRNKKYTYITTEKSKKIRVVMWSAKTHELLIKYIGVRICLDNRPELFQSPHGHTRMRLPARTVQRWCSRIGNELGFKINPHAFRHGKMHEVLKRGGNRHHVKTIAGHSSISSSEVYTRLNTAEQIELMSQFLTK